MHFISVYGFPFLLCIFRDQSVCLYVCYDLRIASDSKTESQISINFVNFIQLRERHFLEKITVEIY
jgi:hypothetical protein